MPMRDLARDTEQRLPPKVTKANSGWGNLRPARKGEPSRNPRGRPKKDLAVADMAREHAQQAIDTLAQCLSDPGASWPAKVSAASELLDRGFGRSPQSLEVEQRTSLSDEFEALLSEIHQNRQKSLRGS